MDVRYLEYILEIANQRSITKAKDRLFISQSTLSQYLIRLEQELGTPLFTRSKNELIPTTAGLLYIQAARSVVEIRRNLYAQIAALRDTGYIRLAVSSTWGMDVAADIAPAFHERFPGVTLDIAQERFVTIRQSLQDGRLDLALTASTGPLALEHELLRREEIVLAVPASHPAANRGIVDSAGFSSFFGQDCFIRSKPGSTILELSQPWLERAGVQMQVACEVNDNHAALAMVSKGLGIAFVPRAYMARYPEAAALSLSPRLERDNLLVFRPNLELGPPQAYLLELIRTHPLFHGG